MLAPRAATSTFPVNPPVRLADLDRETCTDWTLMSTPEPPRPDPQASPELTVRRHERLECCLSGYAQIAPGSTPAVRLARATAQVEGIPVVLVDCSAGGLGLRCEAFLPRSCLVRVQASVPTSQAAAGGDRALDVLVRVQRVSMIDRRPTYYLGTSFHDLTAQQRGDVEWLLRALNQGRVRSQPGAHGAAASEGGARAAV